MPNGPLLDVFRRFVTDRPTTTAVLAHADDLAFDFAALDTAATDLARELARRLGPRELPVALATGNGAGFVTSWLALLRLGVPAVALDGGLPWSEKLALCRRLRVARLLHREPPPPPEPEPGVTRTTEAPAVASAELGRDLWLSSLAEDSPAVPPPDTCLIKVTSGSTGDPVASCFDAVALAHGIRQIGEGMEIDARDRVLIGIPLSHSYGFDNGVLSLLALGTPLVLASARFPARFVTALCDTAATVLPLVPPLVRALGHTAWPREHRLRLVISAGGPLPTDAAAAFRQAAGVPVHQFYGCTESGGISFERQPEDPAAAGTVGHPLPGVTIGFDDDGRVEVRSPANYRAHLGALHDHGPRVVVPGDRGELTADGRLRLLGRSADIFNVGGRKVSAMAVEEALRSLEGVVEATVIGVEDALRGDRIVAFVVSDRPQLDTSPIPSHLQPREIRRLPALPYTERGKVDRHALRRMAGAPA
jgi:acyl-coenzyme A synthetase/AMP-(fatty) acid ligase